MDGWRSSVEVAQDSKDVQEEFDNVEVELNGCEIGVIKSIAVLSFSKHQLSIEDEVNSKQECS